MTPNEFDTNVLMPGLDYIRQNIPFIHASDTEHQMLLAIAGQEGGWAYRVQMGNGPAHSFWQMERGGGITGLLHHPRTQATVAAMCAKERVQAEANAVWAFMATQAGDKFSAAMARLLLYTDPQPLPSVTDEEGSWLYYQRNWRPGKPDRSRWSDCFAQALAVVQPGHEGDTP
jgi:hypothetical protein